MLSMLSSLLPLVFPRSRSLSVITSWLHSRWRMKGRSILSFISCYHLERFSTFLGNPSIRNLPPSKPAFCIAFSRRPTVISLGTIFPSLMLFSMIYPYWDPCVFRSSRSKSPAERWTNLNCSLMLSLCVPLPAPGPPRMKTTVAFLACINKIRYYGLFQKAEYQCSWY